MPPKNKFVTRFLTCTPSKNTETDWRFEHAVGAGLLTIESHPPLNVDLREPWWEIGDQGSTGSGVGWACADSVLRWHFVKKGRISESQHLSTRFIWMAAKEIDVDRPWPTSFIENGGASIKAALEIARKFGAVLESVLPFGSTNLYPDEADLFYTLAAKLKINSYFNLGENQKYWRMWLAQIGPILIRLNVDATWKNALSTAGKLNVFQPDTTRGGHAVALVGYTPDYYLVRNNWGTASWGDAGFAYASPAYAADAFTEAYGVNLE